MNVPFAGHAFNNEGLTGGLTAAEGAKNIPAAPAIAGKKLSNVCGAPRARDGNCMLPDGGR